MITTTKTPDTVAVIENYMFFWHTDRHTHRWTLQPYDQPGPEGQVGENLSEAPVSQPVRGYSGQPWKSLIIRSFMCALVYILSIT